MSWDYKNHCVLMARSNCGTPPYLSPQIHKSEIYNPFSSDDFAMGVMLYVMMHNRMPFIRDNVKKALEQMYNYPDYIKGQVKNVSEECRKLIVGLLNPEEDERFTLHQIMQSDWLANSFD